MAGTVGVSGLLQLPNLLGGPAVSGSTWELIGPTGMACDLGGGRVHGTVVNLIGPTLGGMKHKKNEFVAGIPVLQQPTAIRKKTLTEVGPLTTQEKNAQAHIDIVHRYAFSGK